MKIERIPGPQFIEVTIIQHATYDDDYDGLGVKIKILINTDKIKLVGPEGECTRIEFGDKGKSILCAESYDVIKAKLTGVLFCEIPDVPEKKSMSQCISSDYCKGYNDAVEDMVKRNE